MNTANTPQRALGTFDFTTDPEYRSHLGHHGFEHGCSYCLDPSEAAQALFERAVLWNLAKQQARIIAHRTRAIHGMQDDLWHAMQELDNTNDRADAETAATAALTAQRAALWHLAKQQARTIVRLRAELTDLEPAAAALEAERDDLADQLLTAEQLAAEALERTA